jgi:transcriptional regulator with XRE-family HTH domain
MSNFKKKFGINLKALRKSKNITQEKLAELIDMHHRQISKIETGDNFPSAKTIENICYALKISPSLLFDFDFVYDGEIVLTGTDDIPFYRAVKQGNVVLLEDYKGKQIEQEDISIFNSENRFLNIAKNLKKPLTVEYFEEGKKSKSIIYNPDGTIKTLNEKNPNISKEIEELTESIKKISKNKNYINFIKLAIKSINDNESLERLEFMINGMKMAKSD